MRTVTAALKTMLPECPVIYGDSNHPRFNRAAARNAGVRECLDADVVVVCDADIIPDRQPLLASINTADDGKLHYPFRYCRALSRDGTRDFISGKSAVECEVEYECLGPQGGLFVISPRSWFKAGGMDERFSEWGFEDTAFCVAVRKTIGVEVRHEGIIHHLWHESDRKEDSPEHAANLALCNRYCEAASLDEVRA